MLSHLLYHSTVRPTCDVGKVTSLPAMYPFCGPEPEVQRSHPAEKWPCWDLKSGLLTCFPMGTAVLPQPLPSTSTSTASTVPLKQAWGGCMIPRMFSLPIEMATSPSLPARYPLIFICGRQISVCFGKINVPSILMTEMPHPGRKAYTSPSRSNQTGRPEAVPFLFPQLSRRRLK